MFKMYLEHDDKCKLDSQEPPEEGCVVAGLVSQASVAALLCKSAVGRVCKSEIYVAREIPVVVVLVQQFWQELWSESYQETLEKKHLFSWHYKSFFEVQTDTILPLLILYLFS